MSTMVEVMAYLLCIHYTKTQAASNSFYFIHVFVDVQAGIRAELVRLTIQKELITVHSWSLAYGTREVFTVVLLADVPPLGPL